MINKNKTIGYCRVSASKQDVDNQELEISRYARKNNIKIDDLMSIEISTKKSKESKTY